MSIRRQKGSVVEAVPILVLGVLLTLAGLQLAFYMAGRHTAELAAYRSSRVLDEDPGNRAGAAAVAERTCRLCYPTSLVSVHLETPGPASSVSLRFRLEPLMHLPLGPAFGPMTGEARYPRRLSGREVGR